MSAQRYGNAQQQASAVRHLEAALAHWKAYAGVATSQYKPQHLGRLTRVVDLNALTASTAADIDVARQWHPGIITEPLLTWSMFDMLMIERASICRVKV